MDGAWRVDSVGQNTTVCYGKTFTGDLKTIENIGFKDNDEFRKWVKPNSKKLDSLNAMTTASDLLSPRNSAVTRCRMLSTFCWDLALSFACSLRQYIV